jgi:SOS-response transcriptional repressors (RecA-mediated autopeptidases)
MDNKQKQKDIFAKNLKYQLLLKNKTQADLVNDLKLTSSTVSDWVNAKKYPRMDKVQIIADYLNIYKSELIEEKNINDLSHFDNVFKIEKRKFPMLGTVACGEPIYADEDRESYIIAGTDVKADFCLKCKGDSMINARIYDGDIVFVKKQDIVSNGEIAVVIIEDEATLKRFYYYREQNMVILKPENSKYEDIILTNEQLETVKVLGKAVAFQSDVL